MGVKPPQTLVRLQVAAPNTVRAAWPSNLSGELGLAIGIRVGS
jgi:hypothetical protein